MRKNLPITQREFTFPVGETLVSVTDLKGRITYCNPAFVHVSGFQREELLGQPHNLVRHPDMPAEAFRDMWSTIQSGLPWTGIVKNRRKDGDHYWVQANATPMMNGDEITGFLSVRTVPSREQVQAAEALYATLQKDEDQGRQRYGLRRGNVVRLGLRGWWNTVRSPSLTVRLLLTQVLATLAATLPLLWGASWYLSAPLAFVALIFSSVQIRRATVAPLQRLVRDANRLAAGDLSHAVETGSSDLVGQLQQALNQVSVNLRTVVNDVRAEMDHLGQAVQEIAGLF